MTVVIPEWTDTQVRTITGGACLYCGAELGAPTLMDADDDVPSGAYRQCTNCHCAWMVVDDSFVGRPYRDPDPAVPPPVVAFE